RGIDSGGPCVSASSVPQRAISRRSRVAQTLLDDVQAEKILYIGDDDAMDRVVSGWARDLVGADPADEALFARAAARCANAAPEAIDAFVASERARLRLRVFCALPK